MSDQIRNADWEYGELSARVYDLDKPPGKSLHGDIEFFTEKLADVEGEILEPAVGTGRMLIPLLRKGLRVTGYDTSEHMLKVCRANLEAAGCDAELFVADMAAHRDPGRYDAVLVPTGSIIVLPDRESVLSALRNMRESLRPGGRLYIDVPPLRNFAEKGGLRHWWDGDRELLTLQVMDIDTDHVKQQVVRWLRYELWRDGRLVDTQLQLGHLLWFGVPEFEQLLLEAGFDEVTAFGDYREGAPPAPDAGIWNFEATRA